VYANRRRIRGERGKSLSRLRGGEEGTELRPLVRNRWNAAGASETSPEHPQAAAGACGGVQLGPMLSESGSKISLTSNCGRLRAAAWVFRRHKLLSSCYQAKRRFYHGLLGILRESARSCSTHPDSSSPWALTKRKAYRQPKGYNECPASVIRRPAYGNRAAGRSLTACRTRSVRLGHERRPCRRCSRTVQAPASRKRTSIELSHLRQKCLFWGNERAAGFTWKLIATGSECEMARRERLRD